jgi:DNA topoisomerase-1
MYTPAVRSASVNPIDCADRQKGTAVAINVLPGGLPVPTAVLTTRITSELRYVCDSDPGIRRVGYRTGFRYLDPRGRAVRCRETLARIRALAIPPAWADVWISPEDAGHIQATGRDARGRKQYRYHARWRQARDGTKFNQLVAFGQALPRLRACVDADLGRSGLPREKVLAAVVDLLDRTHLRVGNAEYVRANKSFGLSTLLDRHVAFGGGGLHLRFRGKSGVWHERAVGDRRLARIVRRCRDLPGQDLFQYVNGDGVQRSVGSADVNEFIRQAAGGEFTAKVFRTWAGTVKAAVKLAAKEPPGSKTAANRAVVEVIREVASDLGNTPAVCRKSYVHPAVIDAFIAGELKLNRQRPPEGLSTDEAAVLRFLAGRR